jgi:DNA topoisomerase-1
MDDDTATASLPDDLAPGDVTEEKLKEILEAANAGDQVLGIHPEADQPVLLKSGPYGPYIQLGDDEQKGKPKRVSLPPGVEPEDVDFDMGLQLINLPRELGTHPETGNPIEAGIGRYGPFVRHKKSGEKDTYASLKKSDDVLAVELDRALKLIEAKEARNRPARTLGEHPETEKPIEVWNGRYGPYVKHNNTNASLPDDVTIEDVTLEQAVDLLAKKNKKKGRKKKKA